MRLRFADPAIPTPGIHRRTLVPDRSWRRPAPRLALDLSGRNVDIAPLLDRRLRIHSITLNRLENARLVWSDCFVMPDGLFLCGYDNAQYHAEALAVRDAGSLAQQTAGLTEEDGNFLIDDEKFAAIEDVEDRVLFATPEEPHNWGLFLLSAVPAIGHFLANRGDYAKLFIYFHHPNMRALAALMGVQPEDIHPHDVFRSYRFREIDLLRQSHQDFVADANARAHFSALAASASARYRGPRAPRLFIARLQRSRQPDAPRGLNDEAALATALKALGFITIEPETLPAIGQIQLFAQAEMIVALSGAGLFNAVFCQPRTKVVSLESMPEFALRHATLLASLDLDYSIVLGREDPTDPRPNHRRFSLDLAATVAHIEAFLGL